jgi:hypothetical protein
MPHPVLSTYRLQMRGHDGELPSRAFTFADAERLLDYLSDLGVTHLYLSPVLTAAPGSTHGYDVTDPTSVSAALGGADGLAGLSEAARERGLGLIVDIVPNHAGVDSPSTTNGGGTCCGTGATRATHRSSTSTGQQTPTGASWSRCSNPRPNSTGSPSTATCCDCTG